MVCSTVAELLRRLLIGYFGGKKHSAESEKSRLSENSALAQYQYHDTTSQQTSFFLQTLLGHLEELAKTLLMVRFPVRQFDLA